MKEGGVKLILIQIAVPHEVSEAKGNKRSVWVRLVFSDAHRAHAGELKNKIARPKPSPHIGASALSMGATTDAPSPLELIHVTWTCREPALLSKRTSFDPMVADSSAETNSCLNAESVEGSRRTKHRITFRYRAFPGQICPVKNGDVMAQVDLFTRSPKLEYEALYAKDH